MSDPAATIPGASPASRAERKKRERRKALLDAGLELVREHGIYGLRIEDITGRADMAKGAFYTYFESKDALVAALVADAVQSLKESYLAKLNGATGPERVEKLVHLHEVFLSDNPTYALLLHQTRGALMLPASDDTESLRALFRDYLEAITQALVQSTKTTAEQRDVAAVLAGGVAGARAFTAAAGTAPRGSAAIVLAHGVDSALANKRGKKSK